MKRISKEAIVQVEKLQFRNLTIAIGNGPFDVSTSQVWRRQMKQTRGLIVVVDTLSYFRMQQSKRDLHSLLTTYDEMAAAPILVVATNQKSPGALSDSKIANHLDLFNLPNTWSIYSSTPDHVVGGLLWLSREIRQPNNDLNPDKGKIIEMSSFDEDMPEQVDW